MGSLFGPMDDGVLARVRRAHEEIKQVGFEGVNVVFDNLLKDLEGSPAVRNLALIELRECVVLVEEVHDELQEEESHTVAALLEDVLGKLRTTIDKIEGVHPESPQPKLLQWAVWVVLDQTIGYLDEKGAPTISHKEAKLHPHQQDAVLAYIENGGLRPQNEGGVGIVEVHDEAEFRSREDTW